MAEGGQHAGKIGAASGREQVDKTASRGQKVGAGTVGCTSYGTAIRNDAQVRVGQSFRHGDAHFFARTNLLHAHQVLLIPVVGTDFTGQRNLRGNWGHEHELLGFRVGFTLGLHASSFVAGLFQLALGLQNNRLANRRRIQNRHFFFDVRLAFLFHTQHGHVFFGGFLGLFADALLGGFLGESHLLLFFGGSNTDLLFSFLTIQIDGSSGFDFGCFGFLLVFRYYHTAFAFNTRLLFGHDILDDARIGRLRITQVHELDGLDGNHAPFLDLVVHFIGELSTQFGASLHDLLQAVFCQNAAHRTFQYGVQLRIQFFEVGYTLGHHGRVIHTKEGGYVHHERQSDRIVRLVVRQGHLENRLRKFNDGNPELGHPSRPGKIHVARFFSTAIRRRRLFGLNNVHHVGGNHTA